MRKMPTPVVICRKLTKRYNEKVLAVDSLDLEIQEGEVFGLLGPNGAGKTTTISMLCTLIHSSSGFASVAGFDIRKQPQMVRRNIGIVFQEPSVDDLLTGRENLELHGMLYGMKQPERGRRIKEMLDLVGLNDRADSLVREYSGGMRRRLEIARGLMHKPKILFLDEPTLGLDPASRQHIWDYIVLLSKEHNTTIVLTTHYMEEADLLCSRIGIIDAGKIIALGTPRELKALVGEDIVKLKGKVDLAKIRKLKFVRKATPEGGTCVIALVNAPSNLQSLLKAAGNGVESVEVNQVTLNDVFLHYTGKGIHSEEGGEGSWFDRVVQESATRA